MSHSNKSAFSAIRRRTLLKSGSVVLLFNAWDRAWGSEIVAVRIWPAADYSRVTIESTHPLEATQRMVESPPRLAVDIEGLQLDSTLRELVAKVQPDDPNIAGIRVGQFSPDVVRLVIDLKHPVKPEVFSLKPVAAYKDRLVLDLYPTNPPDPLAQLIASVTKPSTHVAAAPPPKSDSVPLGDNDALSNLIARQLERANGDSSGPREPRKPPAAVASGRTRRLIIVAVDPGHGGEDPGATGPGGTHEKNVVLSIALKLRDRINQSTVNGNPMRAFMTRDSDFYVPLAVRVEKARNVHADLFMSIHADSAPGGTAKGASVYVLSEHGASNTIASWIAKTINNSDRIGGVNLGDKGNYLQRTLLDMSTTAQIKQSLNFGRDMLHSIGNFAPLHGPRIERANFAVLRDPDTPSILVETAFINNAVEEQMLREESFQNDMADAMLKGIMKYFASHPPLARNVQI